jgi:ubiquinone/menaquinone biosynthesis C-methylase UbiE
MNQYATAEYNHKGRWYGYYHQFQNIFNYKPEKVLEIGIGSGITAQVLKENGVKVTTVDNDPKNNPDIVGDVLKLPFEDNTFDMVVAFAILEHLPFSSFSTALKEMSRVAKNNIIISLPDRAKTLLSMTIKVPFIKEKNIQIRLPSVNKKKYWAACGHYWEMGHVGYSRRKIAKEIKKSGLKIRENYVPNESAWIRYFILEKIK